MNIVRRRELLTVICAKKRQARRELKNIHPV